MANPNHISPRNQEATPIFYADQPASVVYGPHVTKITFGVIDDYDSDTLRPVVTIAIPTVSLLGFVADLAHRLSTDDYRLEMVAGLQEAIDALEAVNTPAID